MSFVAPVINNLVTIAQENSLWWICEFVVNIDETIWVAYKLLLKLMYKINIYMCGKSEWLMWKMYEICRCGKAEWLIWNMYEIYICGKAEWLMWNMYEICICGKAEWLVWNM